MEPQRKKAHSDSLQIEKKAVQELRLSMERITELVEELQNILKEEGII